MSNIFKCYSCFIGPCTININDDEHRPIFCPCINMVNTDDLKWEKVKATNKPEQDSNCYNVSFFDKLQCPNWANYIAMHGDGEIWVYENKPTLRENYWVDHSNFITKSKCVGVYLMPDTSNWDNSIIERPKKVENKKPEQDHQVYDISYFDNPNCPSWGNYIAFNQNGEVYIYKNKPNKTEDRFKCVGGDMCIEYKKLGIYLGVDKSNWDNSIIERPKKTPLYFTINVNNNFS